jgi:ribosomal protein L11 methyltransferase
VIRLAVRVRRDEAEIALAQLIDLAPSGVEEIDLGSEIEYAIYGAPGELPTLPDLRAAAGEALVQVSTSEVADDWQDRWRAFHKPISVGNRLHVRPPWADPAPRGALEVVIEPGQAFGTGAHATTRLCLELMLELAPSGGFVDIGCGSGVLAIAAAKLGWSPVLGVDNDPHALSATTDNAAANGVEVRARRYDLLHDGPAPAAPTVAANLLRPALLRLAAVGFRGELPHALVASGLLAAEAGAVAAALAAALGMREARRLQTGEWAAVLLRRTMCDG